VPGNGSNAIHERARQWGEEFHKSVPGFETDEKWYAAAKEHDNIEHWVRTTLTRPRVTAGSPDGGSRPHRA
jgi:hypothetical protein